MKAVASGDRIFLANGQAASGIPLPKVLAFDPVRRRYAPIPDAPQGVDHALLAAYRGDLYVVGGYVRGRPTGKVWRYSSRTGRWTGRAPLRVARGGLDGAVIGGRLYAAGGAPRTYPEVYAKPYATLEVYDFRRNRWLPGPDMPTARHHVAATALGGRLYVLGGRTPEDFSVTDVERFDPRSGRWEKLTPLPLGVGDFSAVTARGQVVAIGGDEEENMEEGKGWVTPAVWSLDPSRGTWKRLPDLRRARHGHGAAVARDRIYVFEGGACPGFSRMRAVESIGFDEAGL